MSIYFCGGSCVEDITTHLMKFENPLRYVKLLPILGDRFAYKITQGAALGKELLPFQAVLEPQAKLESCYSKISDYSSCFFTQTL